MKRLLPFVVLILLVVLVLCAPFLLPLDRYRARISDGLSRRLQHPVLIGRLELGLFPPALRLRDLSVMSPSDNTALLRVDQVLAPVSWRALLKARLAPGALHVSGWTATVHRKRDGTWAWDEWLVPAARLGGDAGWPVNAITFDRGECQVVDTHGAATERLVIQILQGGWERGRQYMSINGVFTNLPAPVSFLFQGSGHFLSNVQWTGVLGLTEGDRQWKLECKTMGGRFQASGRSDEWRFDTAYAVLRYYARLPVAPPPASPSVLLRHWESQFDRQGNTLSTTQSATLADGRAEATGTVLFDPQLPTATVQLGLQGVKLQPVETALWGNAPLEGTATGIVRFALALTSSTWSTLNGQGALEVREGRYYVPGPSMRGLAKAHTLRYLNRKAPGFQTNGMPYQKASVRWQMRRGIVLFEDAFCDLGDIQVAMAGAYDAERRGLDAYARVQIRERDPQLLKELPPTYIYMGEGKPRTPHNGRPPAVWRIQPMHGRVQGAPAEWRLRVVRGSKIPPAIANKLSRTIRSK
ncbi:MAG: hypothetical protein A2992_10235 [Elusimicrobia bacterium RIFCSPLOWO2_01_FULL_59_12]|nr:MAG: hypothetical protein A2992_10235 [Elusimicrobia bacterium RIFCSPLOWO2_01_FULL_59_12]